MKIQRVKVQRVYQIRQFENVRIEFEVVVDGENPREAVLLAYKEIVSMERVIGEFEYTKSDYESLENKIHDAEEYSDIFEMYMDRIKKMKDDKLKALGCLEQVDLTKIESIPTACIEEYDIRTLKDLAERKEKLKEQIAEMDKVLNEIKELHREWLMFIDEYPKALKEAEQYFVEGKYEDAINTLRNIREKIKSLRNRIDDVNPEHYRYSWR